MEGTNRPEPDLTEAFWASLAARTTTQPPTVGELPRYCGGQSVTDAEWDYTHERYFAWVKTHHGFQSRVYASAATGWQWLLEGN